MRCCIVGGGTTDNREALLDVRVVEAINVLSAHTRLQRLEVLAIEQEMHENDALARRYAESDDRAGVDHHVELLMRGEAERALVLAQLRTAMGMMATIREALRNHAAHQALQTSSLRLRELVAAVPDAEAQMDRVRELGTRACARTYTFSREKASPLRARDGQRTGGALGRRWRRRSNALGAGGARADLHGAARRCARPTAGAHRARRPAAGARRRRRRENGVARVCIFFPM